MSIFEKYNSNLKIVYKNYRMVTSRKLIKKGDLHKWYYCYNQKLLKLLVSLVSGAIEMIFSNNLLPRSSKNFKTVFPCSSLMTEFQIN